MALSEQRRRQLDEIVSRMEANNESTDDIQFVVDDFKAKYGGESQSPTAVDSRRQPQTSEPQTQYEKYGTVGALFPATTEATERGGNVLTRTLAGTGDVLTLPARGVFALLTLAGTKAGGGKWSQAAKEAITDLSRTESQEKGALGFAQNMALDPTSSPLIIGAAAPARAVKAVPTIGKVLLKAGGVGAAEAAGSAAYQQARTGKIKAGQTAGQAALGFGIGAGSAGLGKAVRKGVGKLLENTAIRNIDITLRPGQYGKKIGYNHDDVIKHDLIGSPRETYEKATAKINELQKRAKNIGKRSKEKFSTSDFFDNAIKRLDPENAPEEYELQVQLIDNAKKAYLKTFGNQVDALTAMKMRTRIGKKSAFVGRTFGGQKVDPNADWKEDAYNSIYFELKDKLHDKLGGELKKINKAQSEIIPIKMVADRRMPRSESNQRFGLSDLAVARIGQAGAGALGAGAGYYSSPEDRIGGAVKGLAIGAGLAAGRRALGSPTATKMYYRLGKAITPKVEQAATKSGKSIKQTIGKILKSERGAVGGQTPKAETIQAIVDAAERHGGIQNIDMVGTRRSFGNSVQDGFLWYNTPDNSTRVMRIRSPADINFKSQKGSIGGLGGMAQREIGTPAIRDPQTGKIYTGGWRGHKDAIIKGETSKIQERLKYQHFLDNINRPTENVGFIDKKGNFISRTEAERKLTSSMSLAQQFHNIGIMAGTAGAAGTGLTIGAAATRRKRR